MPAKNSTGKFGKKYLTVNNRLWKRFVKETGEDIDYKTFALIIKTNNINIMNFIISDPEGVELPERMGNIVVTKYKKKAGDKLPPDFINIKKLGKFVPLLNLHSFGYVYFVKWYRLERNMKTLRLFNLYRTRPLRRGIAKSVKSGVDFFKWSASDLWNMTRLERRFNKNFKNEE